MAKEAAFNGYIEVNGVNLSDHCMSADVQLNHDDIPQNAFGDTDRYGAPGLKHGDITAQFIQDFASASVHQTLSPLYKNKTKFPLVFQPKSGAAGPTIPQISGSWYIGQYRPFGGEHGGPTVANVTFKRAGNVTINEA